MPARPILITGAAVALSALLAACGSTSGSDASSSPVGNATAAAQQASTADISFAQLMIPHHQQAVEMADLALTQSTSPQVRQLAEQIKSAQDPEIQTMQSWLAAWGAPEQMEGTDHGSMDHGGVTMNGMMSAEDMDDLAASTGAEFDRLWLEMMIAHHRGAVTMAEDVMSNSQTPDVTALAEDIIDAQNAEITAMQGLIDSTS